MDDSLQSKIDRSLGIIRGAFSNQWIEGELAKYKQFKGMDVILKAHPLIDAIKNRFDSNIADLLELSLYLEEFRNDVSIMEAVIQMKDKNSFYNILFELNIAYLLKMANYEVELKPLSQNGKSDILLIIDKVKYFIECSRSNTREEDLISQGIINYLSKNKKLMDSGHAAKINLVLSIHIKNYYLDDLANHILRDAQTLIKEFQDSYQGFKNIKENKNKHYYKEFHCDSYILLLREMAFKIKPNTNPKEKKDYLSKYAVNLIDDINDLPKKEYEMGQIAVILNCIMEDPNRKDEYDRIRDIINKKIKQTKVKDGYRIICIETQALNFLNLNLSKLKEITEGVFKNHRDIASVLICRRMFGSHKRYNLGIVCQQQKYLIPLDFADKIQVARDNISC